MIFPLLFAAVMSGDRPDYEVDIFALLVDLMERPPGPTCDICLLTHISLGVISAILILICVVLFSFRRLRLQYSPGVYKQ